ncbi:MAG: cell division protein FtsA [Candidatus Hydrogenedentota bacterium]
MRRKGEIVGAVDFGSRDVRALIARQDEDGAIQILGHGAAPGKGCVSQGVIQDLGAAQVALKQALADAEKEARLTVQSVFCGINGRNVETFIREERVELDREVVEQEHMDEALQMASRDVLAAGKRVVSSITSQEWYVDELRVMDPIGIRGHVLKTRIHFARVPSVIEDNIAHCIESQRRELEDLIFTPIAAALGCLTPEDMELGVAVLDMGQSTTGLAVYRDRRIIGTSCFEWGAYHITRDLAAGLHISFEEATELMLEYGLAERLIEGGAGMAEALVVGFPGRQTANVPIKLKTVVHGAPPLASREELEMIIFERAKELLTKVRQYVHSRGMAKHLVRGVVVAGGAAHIRNLDKLVESIFQTPCRAGIPEGVEIVPQAAKTSEFVTAVGIARHGFHYRAAAKNGRVERRSSALRKFSRFIRKYFY